MSNNSNASFLRPTRSLSAVAAVLSGIALVVCAFSWRQNGLHGFLILMMIGLFIGSATVALNPASARTRRVAMGVAILLVVLSSLGLWVNALAIDLGHT